MIPEENELSASPNLTLTPALILTSCPSLVLIHDPNLAWIPTLRHPHCGTSVAQAPSELPWGSLSIGSSCISQLVWGRKKPFIEMDTWVSNLSHLSNFIDNSEDYSFQMKF